MQLEVSARSKAAAVPPQGPCWLQELHVFIIAIYIVPGICRGCSRHTHSLGSVMPWEQGPARRWAMGPVLESPTAPTWPLGQVPDPLPQRQSPSRQALIHDFSSGWAEQPRPASVWRTF